MLGVSLQQTLDHLAAAREPLLGILRQRPGDRGLVRGRQAIQPRAAVQVLGRKLRRRAPFERQHAGQHLLIDDRQAVLIAVVVGPAVEQLRCRVDGRQPADVRAVDVLQVFDQSEVAHLDPPAHQQQVLRLDVQVLERMLLVDVVQGIGRIVQIGQQFFARDARQARLAVLVEQLLHARGGQLGHDDQVAVDQLDPLQREDERVAHLLDAVQRAELLHGARSSLS